MRIRMPVYIFSMNDTTTMIHDSDLNFTFRNSDWLSFWILNRCDVPKRFYIMIEPSFRIYMSEMLRDFLLEDSVQNMLRDCDIFLLHVTKRILSSYRTSDRHISKRLDCGIFQETSTIEEEEQFAKMLETCAAEYDRYRYRPVLYYFCMYFFNWLF